jgi:hypothetical protein
MCATVTKEKWQLVDLLEVAFVFKKRKFKNKKRDIIDGINFI